MDEKKEYEFMKLAQDRYAVVKKGEHGHIAIAENESNAENIVKLLNFGSQFNGFTERLVDNTRKLEHHEVDKLRKMSAYLMTINGVLHENLLFLATSLKAQAEEEMESIKKTVEILFDRAEKENERLQAELDRVTKLRPLSEYPEEYKKDRTEVAFFYIFGNEPQFLCVDSWWPECFDAGRVGFPEEATHFVDLPKFVC